MEQVLLFAERVWLRSLGVGDQAFVEGLIADARVRAFLGGVVAPEARAGTFARYCATDPGEAVWLVALNGSDQRIGLVFLSHHKDGLGVELSYQFDPRYWGQGYAFDAVQRVLRHAADDLGADRVFAETQAGNVASCRLLERVGMVALQRLWRFGAEQIIYAT